MAPPPVSTGGEVTSTPAMVRHGTNSDGSLKYKEDVVESIENSPSAFIGLLNGENFGKLVVKVR